MLISKLHTSAVTFDIHSTCFYNDIVTVMNIIISPNFVLNVPLFLNKIANCNKFWATSFRPVWKRSRPP